MSEKIDVICPECPEGENIRQVKKVSWKKKDGGPPYIKKCKKHAQTMSQEQKDKISQALKGKPKTEEMKQKVSVYRKNHPELWETLQYGNSGGWNKGIEMGPMPEETKKKISQSMIGKNKKGNKNES